MSLISVYENIRQKESDFVSSYQCPNCKSKQLSVTNVETQNGEVLTKVELKCEECGEVRSGALDDDD